MNAQVEKERGPIWLFTARKNDLAEATARFHPGTAEIWQNASSLIAGIKMLIGIDPKNFHEDHVAKVRLGKGQASGCASGMTAFATTNFREDLKAITVSTLVLHCDSDGTVPFEGADKRMHAVIAGSQLVVLKDAQHARNASHAEVFNDALLDFLRH